MTDTIKNVEMAMLVFDKVDFRVKKITRGKERHYIIRKELI